VFDNGNFLGLSASYERADGTQGEVADVWFRVSSAEELEQKAAALGEALTSYGASASGTGGVSAGASAKSATAQASLAPSTTPAAHAPTTASAPTTPSSLTPMVPSNIAELAHLLRNYSGSTALDFRIYKGVRQDDRLTVPVHVKTRQENLNNGTIYANQS